MPKLAKNEPGSTVKGTPKIYLSALDLRLAQKTPSLLRPPPSAP